MVVLAVLALVATLAGCKKKMAVSEQARDFDTAEEFRQAVADEIFFVEKTGLCFAISEGFRAKSMVRVDCSEVPAGELVKASK